MKNQQIMEEFKQQLKLQINERLLAEGLITEDTFHRVKGKII